MNTGTKVIEVKEPPALIKAERLPAKLSESAQGLIEFIFWIGLVAFVIFVLLRNVPW